MEHAHRQLMTLAVGIIGLALVGCEDEYHRPVVYGPSQPPVVVAPAPEPYVVEPGYYYDPGYYDLDGFYHAPLYYYYDGRRWEHRDYIPRGHELRERPHAFRQREEHDEHERHEHGR